MEELVLINLAIYSLMVWEEARPRRVAPDPNAQRLPSDGDENKMDGGEVNGAALLAPFRGWGIWWIWTWGGAVAAAA